ncbi:HesA/MoeB/ThiF family protein [Megalodesulfovibrio paquesii]
MLELRDRLGQLFQWRTLPDGSTVRLLPHAATLALASTLDQHPGDVDRAALDVDILPERYLSQAHSLRLADQRRLCNARVALAGLGGLGGLVLEQLARAGVGFIRAADGEVFCPASLNRQFLATQSTLGRRKIEAAVARMGEINPSVTLVACPRMLDQKGMARLLPGADLAIDTLGEEDARAALRRAAREAGMPLVTASITGERGQVAVLWLDQDPAAALPEAHRGQDAPPWAVTLAASLMVHLTVRCLLGSISPGSPCATMSFDLGELTAAPLGR